MAAWLEALRQSLAVSPRFARQLAGLPQVLKGYGDTQLRGRHNYARLWAAHVAPGFSDGDLEAQADRLARGLAATLTDPEGRLNAASSGAPAATAESPIPQTIRWIERPREGA